MFLQVALVILLYMTIIFVVAIILKDNSIVDFFWGPGFVAISAFSLYMAPEYDLRKFIVSFLILLWGIRLAVFIFFRNRGKEEDFRYKHWRETWKFFILRSYFQIYLLQGLIMFVVAYPIYFINYGASEPLSIFDNIGLLIFGFGFLFETIADMQMSFFKKDPKNNGKLMTTGLWKITRHPNYFGESLVWIGISCYALSLPYGWMTLISPVILILLLRFVSGVPMLEKKMKNHPDWDKYADKTAPFVPYVKWL